MKRGVGAQIEMCGVMVSWDCVLFSTVNKSRRRQISFLEKSQFTDDRREREKFLSQIEFEMTKISAVALLKMSSSDLDLKDKTVPC